VLEITRSLAGKDGNHGRSASTGFKSGWELWRREAFLERSSMPAFHDTFMEPHEVILQSKRPQSVISSLRFACLSGMVRSNCVGFGTALLATSLQCMQGMDTAAYQQMGREIYKEIVETDTSHSVGDTTKAAELLAKRFRAAGIPESDIQIIGPEQ